MKKFWRIGISVLAFLFIFSTATACNANNNRMEKIKSSGKLILYTNAAFPPYEFLGNNGNIEGIDIDLGQEISAHLGASLEVNNAEFDGIISAIASGKADLGIAGFTITDERKQQVDFSDAYADSVQYMILPEQSTIQNLEDLKGKSVGTQTGTTGYLFVDDANRLGELKDQPSNLKPYQTPTDAMVSLTEQKLDAVVVDELTAKVLAKEHPGFKAIPFAKRDGTQIKEEFAVAIPKGNQELLNEVNEVIRDFKESGKLEASHQKYEAMFLENVN